MRFFPFKPRVKDLQSFIAFCDRYTPKLWALILTANLPAAQSKTILSNTLIKDWQQSDRRTATENISFTWLVSLAHAEGLPTNTEKTTR